jgi:hypothetical protein
MATNWPTSRDTFTNPSSGDTLDSPSHAAQHANINDAVEAMQLYAGLVLVKSQTIGSGVTSVTVTDAFSSTFENYKITCYCSTATLTNRTMWFRFIDDGGSEITTGYSSANQVFQAGTTTRVATDGYNLSLWNLTAWYGYTDTAFSFDGSIFMPYQNDHATMQAVSGGGTSANVCGGTIRGSMNAQDVYTGFKFGSSAGTFSGGTIRVYGYNNG